MRRVTAPADSDVFVGKRLQIQNQRRLVGRIEMFVQITIHAAGDSTEFADLGIVQFFEIAGMKTIKYY